MGSNRGCCKAYFGNGLSGMILYLTNLARSVELGPKHTPDRLKNSRMLKLRLKNQFPVIETARSRSINWNMLS